MHHSLNKSIEANNEEPKAINFLHDYYLPITMTMYKTGDLEQENSAVWRDIV